MLDCLGCMQVLLVGEPAVKITFYGVVQRQELLAIALCR
jgi:hypothetical protein